MASDTAARRISLQEAIKLAHGKPDRGFTRNDLLVYGGWLNSEWSWSRDVGVSLDQALENALKLGEDVRVVGKPKVRHAHGPSPKNGKSKSWSLGALFSRGSTKKNAHPVERQRPS